jgi:type VI protein secretion system component VasK
MFSVSNVVRRTGETIYTVIDSDHRKVGDVTSDGFFSRSAFHGHVQDRSDETISDQSTRDQMLDAVESYQSWADGR